MSKYTAGASKQGAIKLSSNESPFSLPAHIQEAIIRALPHVHRYPDIYQAELRSELAQYLDVPEHNLIVGNGSNEIISLISHTLLSKDDTTLSAKETFSVYSIASENAHVKMHKIPLQNGYFDLQEMSAYIKKTSAYTATPKIIYICNPNNPTGTCHTVEALHQFISNVPETCYVVLDEAYLDFAEPEFHTSTQNKLTWHPRIILLRTFSKLFAMGGLRLGVGVTHENIAKMLEENCMPFTVNSLAQVAGVHALKSIQEFKNTITHIQSERAMLYQLFHDMEHTPYVSHANFLCVPFGGNDPKMGDKAAEFFSSQNIMIRPLSSFGLPSHVRITIGTKEDNKKVVQALQLFKKECAQYPHYIEVRVYRCRQ